MFLYLYPPSLIIGQMPVKDVHLMKGKNINICLYLIYSVKMSGYIQKTAAMHKMRLILNLHNRHLSILKQLLYSLKTIEYACWRSSLDRYSATFHIQDISLRGYSILNRENNLSSLAYLHFQPIAQYGLHVTGKDFRGSHQRRILTAYQHIFRHFEISAANFH